MERFNCQPFEVLIKCKSDLPTAFLRKQEKQSRALQFNLKYEQLVDPNFAPELYEQLIRPYTGLWWKCGFVS